jgi:hypothetical protein
MQISRKAVSIAARCVTSDDRAVAFAVNEGDGCRGEAFATPTSESTYNVMQMLRPPWKR